jgi:hypothetical protein
LKRLLLTVVLSLSVHATDAPMTNADVIRMVTAGVSKDLVQLAIRNAEPHFNLLPTYLEQLLNAKVPEEVIKAMAERQNGCSATDTETAKTDLKSEKSAMAPTEVAKAKMALTGIRTFEAELISTKTHTTGRLIVSSTEIKHGDLRIPISDITNVVYERASKPRYAAGLLLTWPLLLTKSKQHYLTMQHGDYSIFRLDKSDYREVLAAVEAATGRRIERFEEQ